MTQVQIFQLIVLVIQFACVIIGLIGYNSAKKRK